MSSFDSIWQNKRGKELVALLSLCSYYCVAVYVSCRVMGLRSTTVAFPGNTHLLIHLGQLARDCVVLIFVCFSVLYLGDDAWIS